MINLFSSDIHHCRIYLGPGRPALSSLRLFSDFITRLTDRHITSANSDPKPRRARRCLDDRF